MKKDINESPVVKWNEETSRELRIYPGHPRGVHVNFFFFDYKFTEVEES